MLSLQTVLVPLTALTWAEVPAPWTPRSTPVHHASWDTLENTEMETPNAYVWFMSSHCELLASPLFQLSLPHSPFLASFIFTLSLSPIYNLPPSLHLSIPPSFLPSQYVLELLTVQH